MTGRSHSRGRLGRQCPQHQLRRRAAESLFKQIIHKLLLGLLLRQPSSIDMRSFGFVPFDQSLLGHDLHQFEDGGVTGFAVLAERLMHLADSARPAAPEYSQNCQLRISRS